MRLHALAPILLLFSHPSHALLPEIHFSPATPPYLLHDPEPQPHNQKYPAHLLLKRQSCPSNYKSCAWLGVNSAASSCCDNNSACALDNAGHVACCPYGSYCTGTITLTAAAATSVLAASTLTSNGGVVVVPATTLVVTPTLTTTAANAGITGSASASFVPNTYFPFPYLPSSFANAAACSEGYAACTANYELCTQSLQAGGAFAVTISAPGGGVTVAPGGAGLNLPVASATSICSSLEGLACAGSSATCTTAGNGGVNGAGGGGGVATPTGTGFVVVVSEGDVSADRTGAAWAGMVVGMAWLVVGFW